MKADGVTWQLMVDYWQLSQSTPALAPIVAKYLEVLVSIAHGVTWFTVLDLTNAFFAIPVNRNHWYKFAFMFCSKQVTFTTLSLGYINVS